MNGFLVNLVRRGAGLPASTVQAPPPALFGPEIGTPVDIAPETYETSGDLAMAEQSVPGNTATQAPWRASSSERVEPSLEVSTQPTPAIQRLSATEPSPSGQPAVGEPVTTSRTPSLDPLLAPRWHGLHNTREAPVAPLEPPTLLGPTVPPYLAERQDVTESAVERDLYTPSSVVHDIATVGPPVHHASSLAAASAMVIQEPGQQQGLALPERAPERLRVEAPPQDETALTVPAIRPALEASHTVLDFPRLPAPASPTPSAQLPIHVRIGRVEVRAATASTPAPARPSAPAPIGFDAYYRLRNYRS